MSVPASHGGALYFARGRVLAWLALAVNCTVLLAAPAFGEGLIVQTRAVFDGAGLLGPNCIAVPPDGAHVYVASRLSSAVAAFSRDVDTGGLTWIEAYYTNFDGIDGIYAPIYIAVSPDGRNVYVVASPSVAVFARDSASGKLTFLEAFIEGSDGVEGLSSPRCLAVSPDGANVYVATAGTDSAVVVFNRDNATGHLTLAEAHYDGQRGVDGLLGARFVAVSPDGANVYVAGEEDHAVAVFSRDSATGALSYLERVRDGEDGIEGLGLPRCVIVSSDGAHVYVSGKSWPAFAVLSRDSGTGRLTFVEGLDTLGAGQPMPAMAISSDGASVYEAKTEYGNEVRAFARNAATGGLTKVQTYEIEDGYGDPYLYSMDGYGLSAIAVSPDDRHVYVADEGWNGLLVFSRDTSTGLLTQSGSYFNWDGGAPLPRPESIALTSEGTNLYAASSDRQVYGSWEGVLTAFVRDPATGKLVYLESHLGREVSEEYPLRPEKVRVSPDDHYVYAVTGYYLNYTSGALAAYARDSETGRLTFVDALFDGQDGTDALAGACSLAVSPDSAHIYVAAESDDAVGAFARDPVTGELTFVDARFEGRGGVYGLTGACDVAVSPDGAYVYVLSRGGYYSALGAVAVFSREPATGYLDFVAAYSHTWLFGSASITLSPDGAHLYAMAMEDCSVRVFSRDPATGELSGVATIELGDNSNNVTGLNTAIPPRTLAFSADGSEAFLGTGNINRSGQMYSGVLVFGRTPATGLLTFLEFHQSTGWRLPSDREPGELFMCFPRDLLVSPDDKHLYVASEFFAGSACKIHTLDIVEDAGEGEAEGEGECSIVVQQPAYWCNILEAGNECSIVWLSFGAGPVVRIDLYKGEFLYTTIASATENDSQYQWLIPADYEMGGDYYVRVEDALNPDCDGQSSYFTITPPEGEEGEDDQTNPEGPGCFGGYAVGGPGGPWLGDAVLAAVAIAALIGFRQRHYVYNIHAK